MLTCLTKYSTFTSLNCCFKVSYKSSSFVKNSLSVTFPSNKIFSRYMQSRIALTRTPSILSRSPFKQTSQLSSRNMAVRSINKPDYNSKDPQALKNNPYYSNNKRHFECHRESCIRSDCKNQDCITLCDTSKDNVAVGHATHGQSSSNEIEKTTLVVSSTDLNGNSKPQKIVIYSKPHQTTKTLEHINGTQKLNKDSFMKKTIIQHEDKK